VGVVGSDFTAFLGENPVAVIVGVLILILIWKVISRR
jgi:hypothetical protein